MPLSEQSETNKYRKTSDSISARIDEGELIDRAAYAAREICQPLKGWNSLMLIKDNCRQRETRDLCLNAMQLVLNTYLTLLKLSRHCESVICLCRFNYDFLTLALLSDLFLASILLLSRASFFFRARARQKEKKDIHSRDFTGIGQTSFSMPQLSKQYCSTRQVDQSTVADSIAAGHLTSDVFLLQREEANKTCLARKMIEHICLICLKPKRYSLVSNQ